MTCFTIDVNQGLIQSNDPRSSHTKYILKVVEMTFMLAAQVNLINTVPRPKVESYQIYFKMVIMTSMFCRPGKPDTSMSRKIKPVVMDL